MRLRAEGGPGLVAQQAQMGAKIGVPTSRGPTLVDIPTGDMRFGGLITELLTPHTPTGRRDDFTEVVSKQPKARTCVSAEDIRPRNPLCSCAIGSTAAPLSGPHPRCPPTAHPARVGEPG